MGALKAAVARSATPRMAAPPSVNVGVLSVVHADIVTSTIPVASNLGKFIFSVLVCAQFSKIRPAHRAVYDGGEAIARCRSPPLQAPSADAGSGIAGPRRQSIIADAL